MLSESVHICLYIGIPDAADKLILALGLAGTGQDHSQTHQPYPGHVEFSRGPNAYIIQDLRRCPHNGLNGQVCHHLTGECVYVYAASWDKQCIPMHHQCLL